MKKKYTTFANQITFSAYPDSFDVISNDESKKNKQFILLLILEG